jgi:hypothetical protein
VLNKKEVVINRLFDGPPIFPVVPLTAKRNWMNESRDKFAYKCIPLNVANQYGYAVLCPADFTLDWWGGKEEKDVDFYVTSEEDYFIDHLHSYFGGGTFTIHVDFIIRTPEGFSTYIRGVPNETKQGLKPLDAIVETDWLSYTFTYNFLLTEPGSYSFKKGEPLFVFFPIERNTVENFKLIESKIENNPELSEDFKDYHEKRLKTITAPLKKPTWQYFYRDGVNASGKKVNIKNHITNLIFGGKRGNIKDPGPLE